MIFVIPSIYMSLFVHLFHSSFFVRERYERHVLVWLVMTYGHMAFYAMVYLEDFIFGQNIWTVLLGMLISIQMISGFCSAGRGVWFGVTFVYSFE